MAFNPSAFNTRQYEVAAIGDSATMLPVGAGLKVTKIPTSLSAPGFYFEVAAAGSTDSVFAVVSSQSAAINNVTPGRVVALNSSLVPVLMNANALKGDLIKVKTADGKWEKCVMGDLSDARLLEDGTTGNLAWAKPEQVKV